MVETFDGWEKDYESLEKEENPFRLMFKVFRMMLKFAWNAFKFVMMQLRNMILWIMRRNQRPQSQVMYPVYPSLQN